MIRINVPWRPRVAIVGSGISGLVAARELHGDHDVTLFEANDYVGGHTHTVDVRTGDGLWSVDTGFIVFNPLNYPSFCQLLEELDVAWKATTMSFSVRCDRTGLEYNGTSLNGLFAQRRNLLKPRFLGMVRDILRFHGEARRALALAGDDVTVQEFVDGLGFGAAFMEDFLVPMGSAIWSCPPGRFRRFPVRFVAEFLDNHRMLQVNGRPQWRVIQGGSRRYVDALTAPFRNRIRLGTPVHAVRRFPDRVEVATGRGRVEPFDHVVLACHADQALSILDRPTALERELLGAFPYQPNEAVLHTDVSVLPRRRRAWAAWNSHVGRDDPDRVAVTYNMNILQGLHGPHTFCVTLNDDQGIDPARIIDRFAYDHPVYTRRRAEAQSRHGELIGPHRTSFCGAYWGYGFHEDGVTSALRVCRAFRAAPRSGATVS